MKKLIYFLIIWSLSLNLSLAQTFPYFSLKKTSSGLIIGSEVFNQKTGRAIMPENYTYQWSIADISVTSSKTANNLFFIPADKFSNLVFFNVLFLNLKILNPSTNEVYDFKNYKLNLQNPKIKIARESNGILLPLDSKLNKNDVLVVITKNFSSPNLYYSWEFNGALISKEKEIFLTDLKEKNGTIKVKVAGSLPWESAEDLAQIQVE